MLEIGTILSNFWLEMAAPITGTTFYFLRRRRAKKIERNRIDEISEIVIKDQFSLIYKSKGNYVPEFQDIQIQLGAYFSLEKINHDINSKVGYILVQLHNQIVKANTFPKRMEVLQRLKSRISEWFNDDDPPPPRGGGLKKIIGFIKSKFSKPRIKLTLGKSKATKFVKFITLHISESRLSNRIKGDILYNHKAKVFAKMLLLLIAVEYVLLLLLNIFIANSFFVSPVLLLVNILILVLLNSLGAIVFVNEFYVKKIFAENRIKKDIETKLFKERYSIYKNNIHFENRKVLYYSKEESYLRYKKFLLIKGASVPRIGLAILNNYKTIESLEGGATILVKSRALNWLIYFLNREIKIELKS